jgi:anti-sigma-K factor RskA
MTPGIQDPHTLAGAYVMDAVDEGDRARFEQHLTRCESCREEVRGLREAAAALAAATAVMPPASLRDSALEAAANTRQLPPVTVRDAQPLPGRHPARWGRLSRPGRPRWPSVLAAGLAAAAAVVAVAFGMTSYTRMQQGLDSDQGRDHTVAAVLSSADARMVRGDVTTGGTATVVMSHRMGMLVFTAADLQALPATKSYELWLIGPSGRRSAGMLAGSGQARMVGPVVVSGVSAGDRVGLTVEPAAGSPQPTSRLILLL